MLVLTSVSFGEMIGKILLIVFSAFMILIEFILPMALLLGIVYSVFKQIKEIIQDSRRKKRISLIKHESKAYENLNMLNNKFDFSNLQKRIVYTFECASKREYDSFDFDNQFNIYSHKNITKLRQLKKLAVENSVTYIDYCKQYDEIVATIDKQHSGKSNDYISAERELLEKEKLQPVTSFEIIIRREYKTPKNRNVYCSEKVFLDTQFECAAKEYNKQKQDYLEKKAHIARERAAMSDSLRYRVLQRDGFRCTICGATQSDGVKLHVDHIKPVSKGGKTEMNNLRTLCERCNLGKGSSYDANGLN